MIISQLGVKRELDTTRPFNLMAGWSFIRSHLLIMWQLALIP